MTDELPKVEDTQKPLGILMDTHPLLRQQAVALTKFGPDLARIGEALVATCEAEEGIGLAAPQVGISLRIIVVSGIVYVNPEIVDRSEDVTTQMEGCLSLPGRRCEVKRAKRIKVTYQDCQGKSHKLKSQGFMAAVFQHEVDHLDGILMTDRAELAVPPPVEGVNVRGKRLEVRP